MWLVTPAACGLLLTTADCGRLPSGTASGRPDLERDPAPGAHAIPLPMVLELVRKRSSAGRPCFVLAAPPNCPPSTAKGEACAEACGADGFLGIPSFSKLPRVRLTLRLRARVRDTIRIRG